MYFGFAHHVLQDFYRVCTGLVRVCILWFCNRLIKVHKHVQKVSSLLQRIGPGRVF